MAELERTKVIEQELDKYGVYASVTSGVSMRPLFKTHRDMVIIQKPEGELKKYDVVLYPSVKKDKYILHRIISVKENEYLIRGDNTFFVEHLPKDAIIGVLTEFNRAGKRHSVNEFGFKLYSRVWNFIYPIRYVWHLIRSLLARIYRKIFK